VCGIFGCILQSGEVASIIHNGLKKLEYRGYDSVGIATIQGKKLSIKKDSGKIEEVHLMHNLNALPGRLGIGHTRWATHGAPYKENAHPHTDCNNKIAVVHNGIIENFSEIKTVLEELGHKFRSKTDTEIIAHLIEEKLKTGLSFVDAVRETAKQLEGSYAIAVISVKEPGKIVCARKESPLVLGVSEDALYVASDIPAFLSRTNKSVLIEDGELVILSDKGYEIRKIADWSLVPRKPEIIDWAPEMAEKQGYPHFMLKEIHEQPLRLKNTLRLQDKYLELMTTFLDRAGEVFLVACGTSYHACLAASYLFSKLSFLATHPVIASEFVEQHGKSVNIDSLLLVVSQSGETADTLGAVESARLRAATILGLTNVVGSTLTRIARVYIIQQSGPEIGVAATKTFTSQLSVLSQLAIRLAKKRGKISHVEIEDLEANLERIPNIVKEIISNKEKKVKKLAKKYCDRHCFFFLGKGMSSAVALEGKLKLMEISYIPSLAYPAGESKHGPISLIEKGFPVIFLCPKDSTHRGIIGNIMEMKARGASIIAIIEKGDEEIKKLADDYIEIVTGLPEVLSPIPFVIPLQLLAYYIALERDCDPDKPRNLAKSVTVK
jgi:glucosamine--fructose-6-phosphate aminotransferase (isomerizing)